MSNNILAEKISIGANSIIEPSAIIRGINGPASSFNLGDNCYIGSDVQIICDEFSLGDYSKIHHHTNIHGYKPCFIGHNAWIGQYTIIDCIGGIVIGDNCGIGAHSQLWSHVKYGDTLEGCRFLSEKMLEIGNDVWFVGHCIVSPIKAEDKSMALAGSVVTKDMSYNEIYAGSPAKSISDKVGFQFIERTISDKLEIMERHKKDFGGSENIKIVNGFDFLELNPSTTYFDVSTRTYSKRQTREEVDFMRYLLPDKAKFVPAN